MVNMTNNPSPLETLLASLQRFLTRRSGQEPTAPLGPLTNRESTTPLQNAREGEASKPQPLSGEKKE